MTRSLIRRRPVPSALLALLVFILMRSFCVLTLGLWAAGTDAVHKDPHTLLSLRWDSLWYSRIATHGYGYEVRTHTGDLHSDLAFFPLMPMLERGGHALTGWAVGDVGLVISVASSLLAAAGIYALTDSLTSMLRLPPRTATFTVVLWALLPVGVVQWMAYSESLFTALAAWALYCVQTRRWVLAGLLAAAAGFTRPVGVGVVAAVGVGVLCAWRADRRITGTARGEKVGMLLAICLAPVGMASYVLWVAHRTGRGIAGYLDVQAGWRNGFDGGLTFTRFIADKFTTLSGAAAGMGLIVAVTLCFWAVWACIRMRMPWPVLTYVLVLVALALGAKGYFGSKPRFFVPIFPLLIPVSAWLGRRSPRVVLPGLGVVAVASALFGVVWLNGSGPP